jgi:hypothetical protein
VIAALADVHEQLEPFYSEIGRPSVDPELGDEAFDRIESGGRGRREVEDEARVPVEPCRILS